MKKQVPVLKRIKGLVSFVNTTRINTPFAKYRYKASHRFFKMYLFICTALFQVRINYNIAKVILQY